MILCYGHAHSFVNGRIGRTEKLVSLRQQGHRCVNIACHQQSLIRKAQQKGSLVAQPGATIHCQQAIYLLLESSNSQRRLALRSGQFSVNLVSQLHQRLLPIALLSVQQ
jgi:hypothetical protein